MMNLNIRQVITADKSLIKEFAEEHRLNFYKNFNEENKLSWPSPYDYSFGALHLSPDQSKFLSVGWVRGSNDAYNVYNIHTFITNNRIVDFPVDGWEHENSGCCWINDDTIAVVFNPYKEEEEKASPNSTDEIHFYKK